MPKELHEGIGRDIALSTLAYSKTLYGNGRTRKAAMKAMPVPTFDITRNYVTMADESLEKAHRETKEDFRDARFKLAFDLFLDALRFAAMTFLAVDSQTRWSEFPKKLSAPFNTRLREFISYLSIRFNYEGNFPKDRVDETFREWRSKVEQFITELEIKAKSE